jgi:hypothetical protein
MKTSGRFSVTILIATFSIVAFSQSVAKNNIFDFESSHVNQLPSGWSQYHAGEGASDWKVVDDEGNKVFAQLQGDNGNGSIFNIVVNDEIRTKDLVLTVKLKGVSGRHDRGGGLIWRFIDDKNYYIVRANPLENNVVLYKVEKGVRTDLPLVDKGKTYGVTVSKLGDGWNTLTLDVKGDLFTVYLNNTELFMVKDKTFPNSGRIGLWTKSDAVTYFDNFSIQSH